MWGFAREYVWQNIWDKLLDTVGEDPFNLMFYGTYCVTSIVYWTVKAPASIKCKIVTLISGWSNLPIL